MINKILVAVDSSQEKLFAFDSIVSLAKQTGATLMLLNILSEEDSDYPVFPTYVYYQVLKNPDHSEYQEKWLQYEQRGIDFLRNLTQKAIAAGVEAEYSQLSGIPGQVICELAANWSADLIVVGSRGLKGLNEMFLGSVSNYVTHHAPCSVLIIRNPIDLESDSAFSQELVDSEQLVDGEQKRTANHRSTLIG